MEPVLHGDTDPLRGFHSAPVLWFLAILAIAAVLSFVYNLATERQDDYNPRPATFIGVISCLLHSTSECFGLPRRVLY